MFSGSCPGHTGHVLQLNVKLCRQPNKQHQLYEYSGTAVWHDPSNHIAGNSPNFNTLQWW